MPAPWLLKFWHGAGRSEGKNAMANYAVDSLQDGCYPGTVVLINILGIQNQPDLDAVEGTIVPAKAALWEEKPLAGSCYALLLNN